MLSNRTNRKTYTRSATLDYLQSQVGELRSMAEANKLDLITYFLEMAYAELSDTVRKERPFNSSEEVQFKRAV